MLIVVKIIAAVCLLLIAPMVLGSLWSESGKGINNGAISSYLIGVVSEWAVFFVLAKWAIAREMALHELCKIWMITLLILTVFALIWGIRKHHFSVKNWKDCVREAVVGMLISAVLITLCIVCGGVNQNEYTIESALTMYTTDTLYQYDAVTGQTAEEMLSFQKESLEREASSPIEAYYAVSCFVCKLNPAKFVRILLPFFLLPFYYGAYQVWARTLFGESRKKRVMFQIIIWLLYGSAVVSKRAILFHVFFNCWNGETLFFAGLLPIAVWFMQKESNRVRWFLQYLLCALAGQLLYERGSFVVSFLWGIALLADGVKRWKNDSSI